MGHLDDNDYSHKVIVVGNGAVGKTTIITRLLTGIFDREPKTTIGSQSIYKVIRLSNGMNCGIQIYDIAGQSRFQFLRPMYYRGSSGLILVYDVTREKTFNSAQEWIDEVFEAVSHPVPVALVGNKADLTGEQIVDPSRGSTYADAISREFDVPTLFLETSALTGENIDLLFREVAEMLLYQKRTLRFDTYFQDPLDYRIEKTRWPQTILNLACHDAKYVLRYLGFPEVCGTSVSTEEILGVLSEYNDFHESIDALWGFLFTRLKEQVKGRGPTFDLDIDWLVKNEAAYLVGDIITLRFEEIHSLSMQVNSQIEINPLALWNTYYGRLLIKSMGSPRELNLQDTRKMLLELEAAGVSTGIVRQG